VNRAPQPELSAQERLARSRASMTRWLAEDEQARTATERNGGSSLSNWLQRLRGHPIGALALDALSQRWSRHPLRTSARIAEAAARETLVPLVRRHPVAVLVASAVAGALLLRARPWRWLRRSALLVGVVSQIAAVLLARRAVQAAPGPAAVPPRSEPASPRVR
jgi:hypothetical protein